MKKRSGRTKEKYIEAGSYILLLRAVIDRSTEFLNPVMSSRNWSRWGTLEKSLQVIRSDLEDQMYRDLTGQQVLDHGTDGTGLRDVFYGTGLHQEPWSETDREVHDRAKQILHDMLERCDQL